MNKFIQFITNWRNIVAIILLGGLIACVYFKWYTVIRVIFWILLGANFFRLVYKNYQRRSSLK